ncbi:hypothetical protein [Streptomyces sp. NPDC088726]|uniref:hypothetical protein n=1 Tax=Streptomyces sp. NPDC088726 TaxID=3365874 RepID=UPI003809C831
MAEIDLSVPFSIEGLRRALSDIRGQPLYLHPFPFQAALPKTCGIWLGTSVDDHIFFEQHTSRLHQEHIVLHEIGHMLFDHHTLGAESEVALALLSDLSPHLIKRFLTRANYDTWQEQEAEMFASIVRTEVERIGRSRPRGVPGRLATAFGASAPDGR